MQPVPEAMTVPRRQPVEDATSRYYDGHLNAQKRALDPSPLNVDELASLNLATLLIHSIKAVNLEHITFLLAQPDLLKQLNHNNLHGDLTRKPDTANAFVSAAMLVPESTEQLAFKLQVCRLLLDAGFINVNIGFYCMGISGLSGFEAVCHGQLWPGINEEAHRQLAARVYAIGGQPTRQTHPLAKSPYQLAKAYAPYLIDVVPGNEELNGQQRLWSRDDLPLQDSPQRQREMADPFHWLRQTHRA